ncbi:peptide chain release factor 2 [Buchnera aphidicola]|uniref:Peptide chain release factor 2 n=1 Tax=Buchnera aphidicola subsp. Melaphis rhois TaxID=118103 RepID=A0A4D6YCM5_BUCMH|nr:peptide chain release factor 2 [Buchnera aphidicola]QCI23400.1 peptide chain release factor 2 [Buchnera aphidicola (Melaphis rhois)]
MNEINLIQRRIQVCFDKLNRLRSFFDYNKKNNKLLKINHKLELPETWKSPSLVSSLNREKSTLVSCISVIDRISMDLKGIVEILALSIKENNQNLLCDIVDELNKLDNVISKLELHSIFSKKNDYLNCYLDIQSGSGGTEAQDWANMLFRMYLKWADFKGFKTEIIEITYGEIVGIKSATIKILGKYAFGWLRTETGIHRLVRKSPFNSNNQRHTSFSSAFVYPDIDNSIQVKINSCDLKIDVYRASGAGGQHINKTESAVRITHIPSGLVTQSQSSRSQHKNKDIALKQIKAKLYEMTVNKKKNEKKLLNNQKSDIRWGNQIRSYILDSSKIKDLRTGIEINDVQSVLDGNLDLFIKSSLIRGF